MKGTNVRETNGNWKGDLATVAAGYLRARTMYPSKPCSTCGKKAEIHHRDGNTLNNEPTNIDFLCRRCHMLADGRMERRSPKGTFSVAVAKK